MSIYKDNEPKKAKSKKTSRASKSANTVLPPIELDEPELSIDDLKALIAAILPTVIPDSPYKIKVLITQFDNNTSMIPALPIPEYLSKYHRSLAEQQRRRKNRITSTLKLVSSKDSIVKKKSKKPNLSLIKTKRDKNG